jgi:hypothetical protein
MRRIAGIAAAWVAATLLAIAVAAAAVSSVRSEVTDVPTALGAPSTAAPTTTLLPTLDELSTSTTVSSPETTTTTVDDNDDVETTTTLGEVDTSTVSTTTTTAAPVATTTTTTTATTTTNAGYTKTYGAEAGLPGSVSITVTGASVTFAGATPLPGWTVEVKNSGPEEVKVHFERNDDEDEKIEFKAKVEDGELDVKISEDREHDEDD